MSEIPCSDDELVITKVRPVGKETIIIAGDNDDDDDDDVITTDSFTLQQDKKPAGPTARLRRARASRRGPYKRPATRPVNSLSKRKLEKWSDFVAEWSEIEEALLSRSDLGEKVVEFSGWVELLQRDDALKLWEEPLLERRHGLKKAVGDSDDASLLEWAEGMLMGAFKL